MYKFTTVNLLKMSDLRKGQFTFLEVDIEKLLLAGITEVKISDEFGERMREEFLSAAPEGAYTPNGTIHFVTDAMIKASKKRNKKMGDSRTVEDVAEELQNIQKSK